MPVRGFVLGSGGSVCSVVWAVAAAGCVTGKGQCTWGVFVGGLASEWTRAVRHPFLAAGVVAALAMVVTRSADSADGNP